MAFAVYLQRLVALIINVVTFQWIRRLLQDFAFRSVAFSLCIEKKKKKRLNELAWNSVWMQYNFKDKWLWYLPGCLLVGWSDGYDSLRHPSLSFSHRKQKQGFKNNRTGKAGREIDILATISDPLSFTYPFHSWSASPHTPASLRDISCVQRGDKTHCLSASVGQYIHLVHIAARATVPV